MNDIEEVRNRLKKRRGNKAPLDDSKFKSLYNSMIRFMVIILVALFVASYNKTNDLTLLMNNVLDNQNYQLIASWIKTNILPFEFDQEVSQLVTYVSLGEDEYTNYSNEVLSLDSGRVIYIGYQEIMGYYATVLLENDVQVTYSSLESINIELYDTVEINQTIGTYQDRFVMLFEYLGESITYETYQGME